MKTKEERLTKKIVEILADYKFNSTQISTAEQVAERIIEIVKQEAREEIKRQKDDLIIQLNNIIKILDGEKIK